MRNERVIAFICDDQLRGGEDPVRCCGEVDLDPSVNGNTRVPLGICLAIKECRHIVCRANVPSEPGGIERTDGCRLADLDIRTLTRCSLDIHRNEFMVHVDGPGDHV